MIQINNLSKKFRSYKKKPGLMGTFASFFSRTYIDKFAVENFSFNIEKGEIVGLLGPNGAGKTTLMKMLTGIIVPSEGEIKVLGHVPYQRDFGFRKKIALVMGQKSQLWWDIPAMDSLKLLQSYYEIDDKTFNQKIEHMGKLLGVSDLLHIHVRKLSLGERMKLELIASLLHSPEVIFLDEPTIGLDLIAQANIRNFLLDYHKENDVTIILTSHYMEDVKALCERIILVADGKKSYDGPISEFESLLGNKKNVTFGFDTAPNKNDEVWKNINPNWEHDKKVEVQIPIDLLKDYSLKILSQYTVNEFNTDKLPIEKVMKTLMENPQFLSHDN